jgi:hypothetical protein
MRCCGRQRQYLRRIQRIPHLAKGWSEWRAFCGSARMSSVATVSPQIFRVAFDFRKRSKNHAFSYSENGCWWLILAKIRNLSVAILDYYLFLTSPFIKLTSHIRFNFGFARHPSPNRDFEESSTPRSNVSGQ